jgi:glycosyltransferase involved in cell wall biosynthesis
VGDAGLLVDAPASDELTDALMTLATDDTLRARLREAGLQRVTRYSWERAVRNTNAAIGELLERGA